MHETLQLSEFIANTNFVDLPPQTVKKAKTNILDTIASALYSSGKEWSRIIIEYASQNSNKNVASIIGGKHLGDLKTTTTSMAALANGTLAHGFELDDTHVASNSHPGCVIIPAALAAGETKESDGRTFISAVVLGYEAMCRIGRAVGREHNLRGFHPTGTNGVFGSTAAVCKILNLNKTKIASALGIAGSMASGLKEFCFKGEMTKRLHAGCAAERGIMSAYLADAGFTGPETILEGKYGYLNLYSENPGPEEITRNLGKSYEIEFTDLKPYSCCRSIQPAIEAVEKIRNKYKIDHEEIEEIVVGGGKKLVAQNSGSGQKSIMAAQYSTLFTVALCFFADLRDPRSFNERMLKDERVINLSKKIRTAFDPEIEKRSHISRAAKVTIRLKGNEKYSETVLTAKGHFENSLSDEEVKEKFDRLTFDVLDKNKRKGFIELIEHIEQLHNIKELFSAL